MSLDGSMQPLIRIPRGTKVIRFFHERETENIGGGSWGQKRHFRHSFVWDDRDRAGGPTDTQSQTGRQTTREGQSTKCTGNAGWHTRGHVSFQRSRALSPGMRTTHSHPLPKNLVSLWGRCWSLPGTRKRGRGRGRGHKRNGRWADGWMDWQCYQSERRRNLLVKPFCVYLT